jgi:nitroreductase
MLRDVRHPRYKTEIQLFRPFSKEHDIAFHAGNQISDNSSALRRHPAQGGLFNGNLGLGACGLRRTPVPTGLAPGSFGSMETWDAITARRNVRAYQDRPISGTDLHRILEAGRRAPSASNRQRWDFVVSTDRSQLQALSSVWQGAGHVAGSAATITLVLPGPADDRARLLDQYDLGQATVLMMLAAADLGIGSGHAAIGDQAACRRILGIPDNYDPVYLLALGYPADRPLGPIERPKRRPFNEVVHNGHW